MVFGRPSSSNEWIFIGNHAERGRDGAALHEEVRAEPTHALHAEAQVELAGLLELVLLRLRQKRVAELLRLVLRLSGGVLRGIRWPSMRSWGGEPHVMCRSLAPFSTMNFRSWCRLAMGRRSVDGEQFRTTSAVVVTPSSNLVKAA
jgi:hypothetical protein